MDASVKDSLKCAFLGAPGEKTEIPRYSNSERTSGKNKDRYNNARENCINVNSQLVCIYIFIAPPDWKSLILFLTPSSDQTLSGSFLMP